MIRATGHSHTCKVPYEWYLALAEREVQETVSGLPCMAAELCGWGKAELQNSALWFPDDISQDANFLKGGFPDLEIECGDICLAVSWGACAMG